MRVIFTILIIGMCFPAAAQFTKHVDEHGNVTYSDDPSYDYSQDDRDDTEIQDEQAQIDEYLAERDEAARREQARPAKDSSSIGIRRGAVSRSINYRKCRFLKRHGLKCY